MKHSLVKLLLSSIFIIGCLGQTAFAKTDDAGVLAGLESNSDIYSYLNYYHYSLWLADHRYSYHDMYISADQSVIIIHYGIVYTTEYDIYHKIWVCN